MKRLVIAAAAIALLAPAGAAFAQPRHHDDHRGGPAMMMGRPGGGHNWRKGDHFDRASWGRYDRVDYRRYRLRQPPRGYEWRRVDNNFVLAAVATGLIASVVAASQY